MSEISHEDDLSGMLPYEILAEIQQRDARIAALEAALALAVDALSEVRDDYDHMIEGGPARAPEDAAVTALCGQWGYGSVISRAAYLWQQKDASGAFTKGPCAGTVRSNLTLVRKALKQARAALAGESAP